VKQRKKGQETLIEDAILKDRSNLGFSGALAIRNCRLGENSGAVDVLLLPRGGPVRVVLIEAKVSTAADAASKVIGQLLMYYAGALSIGSHGWESIREFAQDSKKKPEALSRVSLKSVSGGVSPPDKAWKALAKGPKLRPEQVRLYVAMNGEPHRAFIHLYRMLRRHHGIIIGLIRVSNGRAQMVRRLTAKADC
jgi:hypothetical protein